MKKHVKSIGQVLKGDVENSNGFFLNEFESNCQASFEGVVNLPSPRDGRRWY